MCEKYLYGSEGGAGHDRPYPYLRHQQKVAKPTKRRRRGGRSRANVSKRIAKRDSRATTPSAPFRNGTIFCRRGHPSFTRRGMSSPASARYSLIKVI
jgi:hypothetical protein